MTRTDAQSDEPHRQTPACACNGEALELVVTAPRVGPFPELRTYRCGDCGHVITIEAE